MLAGLALNVVTIGPLGFTLASILLFTGLGALLSKRFADRPRRAVVTSGLALLALGIERGDRVAIYMGMVPELPIAMLACARIGAVHSVVFGGFAPHSVADRINDCAAKVVITADEGRRGGKVN